MHAFSKESSDVVSGRNGFTRKVPRRNPAPIMACMAIVNGLDLTGPIVKTTRLQSAVTPAPRAKLCSARTVTNRPKLRMKGRDHIRAPLKHIMKARKVIFFIPVTQYLEEHYI